MSTKISLLFVVLMPLFASAQTASKERFLQGYADFAWVQYSAAVDTAKELERAIKALTTSPSADTLQQARLAWTAARAAYLPTEAFRMANGPIDRVGGPESFLNAWPLDESAIDYVVGNTGAGIINNVTEYPTISAKVLIELNEKAAENSITTGYHAIEFLLWGQDLSVTGPGERGFEDFVIGVSPNAERRAQYLNVIATLLVEHLSQVATEWDQSNAGVYVHTFLQPQSVDQQFTAVLQGLITLIGDELSQERMYVALDARSQEEEHSCFSDQTHLDFISDFRGFEMLLRGLSDGQSLMAMLQVKNPAMAVALNTALDETYAAIVAIPAPFDQAIFDVEGRVRILRAVEAHENLAELLAAAQAELD